MAHLYSLETHSVQVITKLQTKDNWLLGLVQSFGILASNQMEGFWLRPLKMADMTDWV